MAVSFVSPVLSAKVLGEVALVEAALLALSTALLQLASLDKLRQANRHEFSKVREGGLNVTST